jgi:hypothetical protein
MASHRCHCWLKWKSAPKIERKPKKKRSSALSPILMKRDWFLTGSMHE